MSNTRNINQIKTKIQTTLSAYDSSLYWEYKDFYSRPMKIGDDTYIRLAVKELVVEGFVIMNPWGYDTFCLRGDS